MTSQETNVIYLTSFARDMYISSGIKLIDTFTKYQPNDKLIVCYEGFDFKSNNPNIIGYPLHTSEFLIKWLKDNQDVIPDYLGGKATIQNNPDIFNNSWNRLASRWFRKIASMSYVLDNYGKDHTHLIWIDADCYFKASLTNKKIEDIFGKNDVFYHLGPKRKANGLGVESGIIGFKKGKGYQFLLRVIEKYRSGSYRQYIKWDDGYIFRKAIEEQGFIHQRIPREEWIYCTDLVKDLKKQKKSEVIPYGAFKDYIIHEKGKHKKQNIRI